ncbi:MAG: deoxyribodipyrimidine photolyase [Planctomycetes bacterium]|nr:deoxyribodipyrimidine photolyase [Planctomycetota bacterium]
MNKVPVIRVKACNDAPPSPGGQYVLYWLIAARRPRYNFGLQRAIELAREHGVGVLVFEPLRCDYRWANDRIHQFVIEGMRENARAFLESPLAYYPYVEPTPGAGKGLLTALAESAVAVVTDEYPCFFLPRMVEAAADSLPVRLEQVDSNGLLPLRAAERAFTVAHSFRRFLQKELRPYLDALPLEQPLGGLELPKAQIPAGVVKRWPAADFEALADLSALPIDHGVPTAQQKGGWESAQVHLDAWVDRQFGAYEEDRNHPDHDVTSSISAWLHFGHLSSFEVLQAVAWREGWEPGRLTGKTDGRRGWWGMSDCGEAFMDQVVTWRELGFQWCHKHPEDYDRFDNLPEFARITLNRHAHDRRPYVYTLEQFETAQTHDEVWNAAQRQLLVEGRIHNYLRMLWGKKILHWTESPQQALEFMIHLNNKYALDGRDPNSYSGIMWCLGQFDRAWGPERPVFGKIRYMTSDSTRRKCRIEEYLLRYGRDA